MKRVLCQQWVEIKQGYGCQPDGYSLHLSRQHRDAFVEQHYYTTGDDDSFVSAHGDAFVVEINDDTYDKLLDNFHDGTFGLWREGQSPEMASIRLSWDGDQY